MYDIDNIATILETAGFGTIGEDIFAYAATPEATNCIILQPSNDPPIINPETPTYYRGKFQVIVRNFDLTEARRISQEVSASLSLYDFEDDTILIKQLRPLAQVRIYRRSLSGDIESSVTYSIVYVVK